MLLYHIEALPVCEGGSFFIGDHGDSTRRHVLLDISSGSVTPLPSIWQRIFLATSGGGTIIYFTDEGGHSVWRFNISDPVRAPTLVRNLGHITRGK